MAPQPPQTPQMPQPPVNDDSPSPSCHSLSVSTTSLVFDCLHDEAEKAPPISTAATVTAPETKPEGDDDADDELNPFLAQPSRGRPMDHGLRRVLIIVTLVVGSAWLAALAVYLVSGSYRHASESEHDPDAKARGSGKAVTLDQVLDGFWYSKSHFISWIADPDGQDGLLLEKGAAGKDYLVVEDVRVNKAGSDMLTEFDVAAPLAKSRTLMKQKFFKYNGKLLYPEWLEPSPDLTKVLLAVSYEKNWRHSFSASYFILNVESGAVDPLVPCNTSARVQLAGWSPTSDAVSLTMDNNLYIRRLGANATVDAITTDGGPEYFYGIPDWVYEEEVLEGRVATWWSADGQYLAFLRTNETGVREFPIQYYGSRPKGEEAYPEVRQIKYPKPGSHNPVVDLLFYDVARHEAFSVGIDDDFADDDRIVNIVLWAGSRVLVKQTNRVGDHLKVVLVDVAARSAKTVNDNNIAELDGGWYEILHKMTYVPADPARGRPHDGYVDTVIHDGFEHLAYFSPLDAARPVMLTSGSWEVEAAPSAVDLANGLVYFVAAKESPIQRHVYSVRLDGSDLTPLTDTHADGYFSASFSTGAGFALLSYEGPRIPYQKVVSTPLSAARFERTIEDNAQLGERARTHELPVVSRGTLDLGDGVRINYMERRPAHFDARKKHPVLFHQYSGPSSQMVTTRFSVDFQAYVAAALGYIVVTVDPRGTGFCGRHHRVGVRSRLGELEAHDHIAAARFFAARDYVDPRRLAIWGWSYGGFATLKTLERDAGATFSYGMAVAPVTDWRLYDSVYTERYMRLPTDNADGYAASAVANASALAAGTRFLLMHGTGDDNVHFQNSLRLLDALDLAGVSNYDVHIFPDSDHSISLHNANRILYQKLNDWLINAFNCEWLKTKSPHPIARLRRRLFQSSSPPSPPLPSSSAFPPLV